MLSSPAGPGCAPELSEDFADRLAARLASEPVPARRHPKPGQAEARPASAVHLMPAAQGQGTTATQATIVCEATTDAVAVSQVKPAIISVS